MKALLLPLALVVAPAAHARPALNHVYVVLDQATFDAIRGDPRVTELLGPSDGGLPDYAPPPADADRIFLRGRTTYLELFAPKNRFDEPIGKIGIALAEDRPRQFEQLAQRWQAYCPAGYSHATVEWTRSQPPIPWYDSAQCQDTAIRRDVSVWAMVYRPAFGQWQRGSPVTDRRAILYPRRATGQGRFDVSALELSVPAALQTRLKAQLIQAGFVADARGNATVLRGRAWTLTLRPTHQSVASLTAIRMKARSTRPLSLRLGATRLTTARNEASLTF